MKNLMGRSSDPWNVGFSIARCSTTLKLDFWQRILKKHEPGWWLSLPLWKIWVRQLGWWHSRIYIYINEKIKHVPNHQPVNPFWIFSAMAILVCLNIYREIIPRNWGLIIMFRIKTCHCMGFFHHFHTPNGLLYPREISWLSTMFTIQMHQHNHFFGGLAFDFPSSHNFDASSISITIFHIN